MLLILDGIDCCGKSTAAGELAKVYGETNTVILHFPSAETKQEAENTELVMQSALSYLTDMVNVLSSEVFPALREGKTVIIDRFHFSTAVYQGLRLHNALNKADKNTIGRLFYAADFIITRTLGELLVKEALQNKIMPTDNRFQVFHIVLDVSETKAMERCKARTTDADKYEQESEEVWKNRRKSYIYLSDKSELACGLVSVDDKSPEEVAKLITDKIEELTKSNG